MILLLLYKYIQNDKDMLSRILSLFTDFSSPQNKIKYRFIMDMLGKGEYKVLFYYMKKRSVLF